MLERIVENQSGWGYSIQDSKDWVRNLHLSGGRGRIIKVF